MRNIPLFTTENGVASLILEEIPYKGCAYIRLQSTNDADVFIKECSDFCIAVGAEHVYATGMGLERYPLYNSVLQMSRSVSDLPETDADLVPVLEENLAQWRDIYNHRMSDVDNAATMTLSKARSVLNNGGCYFVYKESCLLGIGMVIGQTICAIASVVAGAGKDILLALCRTIKGESVSVELSSTNVPAVKLYTKLGFVEKCYIEDWYQII